ncbi:MAG: 4Fe-4S binding protein [Lentisphaerae bacterium]|jgi:Fe-S-cluster-containing hydrogenase component 2|nr:4Fe-4S binding protein [Lentisphaerota bacterium]
MAAVVDKEKCVGCGACVDECPVEAIKIDDDKAVINEDDCVSCGACVDACPCEAIEVKD